MVLETAPALHKTPLAPSMKHLRGIEGYKFYTWETDTSIYCQNVEIEKIICSL